MSVHMAHVMILSVPNQQHRSDLAGKLASFQRNSNPNWCGFHLCKTSPILIDRGTGKIYIALTDFKGDSLQALKTPGLTDISLKLNTELAAVVPSHLKSQTSTHHVFTAA